MPRASWIRAVRDRGAVHAGPSAPDMGLPSADERSRIMQSRLVTTLAAVTMLAAATITASAANAGRLHAPGTAATKVGPASPCQSNLNPSDDTLQSVPAQRFQGSPTINTRGATLVLVPAGGSCTVNYLIAIGRLSGSAPSIAVNIWVR